MKLVAVLFILLIGCGPDACGPSADDSPATPGQEAETATVTVEELVATLRRRSRDYAAIDAEWRDDVEHYTVLREGFDVQRRSLLVALLEHEEIPLGAATYAVGDLQALHAERMTQPDLLAFRMATESDLSPLLLHHLMVVEGIPPTSQGDNPLLDRTLPAVDLHQALRRDDPWVVAAALFLARKHPGVLPVQEVVDRWQDAPRLWDDTCTEQALLLLAEQPPAVIAALAVDAPAVRKVMQRLERPVSDLCTLDLKAFVFPVDPLDEWSLFDPDDGGLRVTRADGSEVANWKGGLPPGLYAVRYLSGPMHSAPTPVPCEVGRVTRLVLKVVAGV
jgi:hypothetical protein